MTTPQTNTRFKTEGKGDLSTFLPCSVPDYEVQGILFEILRSAWLSADLARLVQNHRYDGGSLNGNEITSCSVDDLCDGIIKISNKQMSLIDTISHHLQVDCSNIETTFVNMFDSYNENQKPPVSTAYKQDLQDRGLI